MELIICVVSLYLEGSYLNFQLIHHPWDDQLTPSDFTYVFSKVSLILGITTVRKGYVLKNIIQYSTIFP
jgi:hypothetical protein